MTSDSSTKITGKSSETSDDALRLFSAYDAVCHAEEQLDSIEKDIENSIPKKIDLCKIQEVLIILDKIQGAMIDVQNVMTSSITNVLSGASQDVANLANEGLDTAKTSVTNVLSGASQDVANLANEGLDTAKTSVTNKLSKDSSITQLSVDSKYTKYLATQIILKKFQILKYRIELIKTGVQITIAKLTKSVLSGILCGKGSAKDPINATISSTMTSAAAAANTILSVIDSIVTMINSIIIMNVNGAGMAFFQTPKSITKVDIIIANSNQSITNNIPGSVDQMISKAENKIRESNGKIKQAKILSMGAAGAASASSGNFNAGSFGSLPKFDPSIIRNAVTMLMQMLADADAIPRYEKLSVSNIRFLVFLVTGFEPAGKRTFGIPGFP
jgi:hypothetical protein